jgi:two-component sensor histidine kinase/ligand-binding sensor protein
VVVGAGWQDVCTKFHRAHPESCKHCVESDTQLSEGVAPGEFRLYKCKNNMWDVATPIMIGERKMGNLFIGQFFFDDESPDVESFRAQAQRYGFDEQPYLAALEAVPRLSRAAVDTGMAFFIHLAQMISLLSYSNIKLARSIGERDALIEERRQAEQSLRQSEDRLKASLGEKEVLLKEIHHRVKNNMQVISSLVALQADRVSDAAMCDVLQDVSHRVRSMALVHEKLYQSADMACVEFAEYAQSLLNYLWRSHGDAAAEIQISTDLQPVSLSVNAAVPCGLILNELVSNAIKHAFRGRGDRNSEAAIRPEVTVSLRANPNGRVCLCVRDNGTGLPVDFDWRAADTLGLRLVQMLAGQIHATVEVANNEGTEFAIAFGGPKNTEYQGL